jgi:phosphoribosylanthranilate isomerase
MHRGPARLILSGGLTPDNVAEAVAVARPFAVDSASGTEAEPGRKDPAKVEAFFRAVAAADQRIEAA